MKTPFDYVLMEVAARFGMDKSPWDERKKFTLDNMDTLEALTLAAKEPILFDSAVRSLRKVQNKQPTTQGVMFDCSASGMQLLSILTGDRNAARICNVIGDSINDPYTYLYDVMSSTCSNGSTEVFERDDLKTAILTALYGSEAEPGKLFSGLVLDAFYETMSTELPYVWELNQFLLDYQKNSDDKSNDWIMPDNFHVYCPVTEKVNYTVPCAGSMHEVIIERNRPHRRNRSLGANTTHSVESLVARELIRRCNPTTRFLVDNEMVETLWDLYSQSGFLSARILDYVIPEGFDTTHKIEELQDKMASKAFPIKGVHDCFSCHPNNAQFMLDTYREIYAELSDSNLLQYILRQSLKDPNLSISVDHFGDDIRKSSYILS